MAIFGSLGDFNLVEVLSLVRFESGRLLIHSKNGPASLFIENYHVLCAYQGVEPVSPKWLVPLLAGLAREREAEFQFDEGIRLMEPCPPPHPLRALPG